MTEVTKEKAEPPPTTDDDGSGAKDGKNRDDDEKADLDKEGSSSMDLDDEDAGKEEKKEESEDKKESEEENDADKEDDDEETSSKKKNTKKKESRRIEDWPLREISEPHDNDVLYGRGGGTNHHPGNKRYRKMVEDRKLDYVNSKRLDKPLVALEIIREWRAQDPPGRFLKIDEKTGLWHDVGDKKAREKTSQALREKAPQIRKQQEEEKTAKEQKDHGGDGGDDHEEMAVEEKKVTKTTRFAEGTNTEGRKNKTKKPVLARDHSLGREYLEAGEAVTLDGFSWQDPFGNNSNGRTGSGNDNGPSSPSSSSSGPQPPHQRHVSGEGTGPQYHPPSQPLPPPLPAPAVDDPYNRYPSQGSLGGHPPPSGPYAHITSGGGDGHIRIGSTSSQGGYETWGPAGGGPPPMPGYASYGTPPPPHWSQQQQQRDSSVGGQCREHSFSRNPLAHASVSQSAPYGAFDRGASTGQPQHQHPPWASHGGYGGGGNGHPVVVVERSSPPPAAHYHQSSYHHVRGGGADQHQRSPPSPPYVVDPTVANAWSGGQEGAGDAVIAKTWSGSSSSEEYDRFRVDVSGSGLGGPSPLTHSPRSHRHRDQQERRSTNRSHRRHRRHQQQEHPQQRNGSEMPRPDMVKRATSHQNETAETKPDLCGPSVKRAALNRDSSAAANRLKEKYLPDYNKRGNNGNSNGVTDAEMNNLRDNLEQSTLTGSGATEGAIDTGLKPRPLSDEERTSTLDRIAMDLMVKPTRLSSDNRSSTIDALNLDLDDDVIGGGNDPLLGVKPPSGSAMSRTSTMEAVFTDLKGSLEVQLLPKPGALSSNDRVTTTDYLNMINEPIGAADEDEEGAYRVGRRRTSATKTQGTALDAFRETSVSEWAV